MTGRLSEQEPTPWTPGPWRLAHTTDEEGDPWYWIENDAGGSPLDSGYMTDTPHPNYVKNMELTALAPEMAEAILKLADKSTPWDSNTVKLVDAVAEKLRAINPDKKDKTVSE